MQKWVVITALCARISIGLFTTTFFQPDEYFQSLEVAHRYVFGYGHLTWEWLAEKPIRSFLYPALNIPVYWLLKVLSLDDTALLIWSPRLLHGMLAAATDIWLYKLSTRIVGQRYANVAVLVSITSFFHGLALSRSLSNSLETSLTTIALSHFPWGIPQSSWRYDLRRAFVFAALACAVRPTNAVIWVYLTCLLLWRLRFDKRRVISIITDGMFIGFVTIAFLLVVDSTYYGKLTFTPLNFLATNLTSVSLFYGSNTWHYYLSQALPIICTVTLPFVLHGIWLTTTRFATHEIRDMLGLIAWTIGIYSLAGHKEWRFIHPLLPSLHILAATSLVYLYDAKAIRTGLPKKLRVFPIRKLHLCLLLLNLPAIYYVVRVHGRAQIEVMHYLRSLPSSEIRSAGFLMPCHSTPWQAYLHLHSLADDGNLWAIGCEPPLHGEDLQSYEDQTDVFYKSPVAYLRDRFPPEVDPSFPPSPYPSSKPGVLEDARYSWKHTWPQYLVFFGDLQEREFVSLLHDKGYGPVWHAQYGLDNEDSRSGGVVVWKYGV